MMSPHRWIAVKDELPDAGILVETMIADEHGVRNEAFLRLSNNNWWFEDGSMYVYYTPTHWRPLE